MCEKALYNTYFDENCHLKMQDGNDKVGKGIYCLNTLCGDEPLRKKDGTLLTNISGTCTGCCDECKDSGCYGIRNQIFRNNNMVTWNRNTILAKEYPEILFKELQDFIDRNIIAAIRYHSFGEIPSVKYLLLMVEIAKANPMVQFYTYTKRYNFIEVYLKEYGSFPNNLTVNVSIWHNNYDNPYHLPEFILDDGTDKNIAELPHCPAVDKKGHETGITCSTCKKCLYAKVNSKTAVYKH